MQHNILDKIKQKTLTFLSKLNLNKSEIFGTEPPHPNLYNYDTTPGGVPIIPREDVKTTVSGKQVFGGFEIVSTGKHSFVTRTVNLHEGQMFAFKNENPNRPALVFEVVKKSKNSIETQDIGYLANSVNPENISKEKQNAAPQLMKNMDS